MKGKRQRKKLLRRRKRDRDRCKRNYWEEMQIFDEREIGH